MAPPDEALQSEGALEEESLSHDEYPGLVGGPSKKNKNKKRTVIARGPTAMAAFRGTGFEGTDNDLYFTVWISRATKRATRILL